MHKHKRTPPPTHTHNTSKHASLKLLLQLLLLRCVHSLVVLRNDTEEEHDWRWHMLKVCRRGKYQFDHLTISNDDLLSVKCPLQQMQASCWNTDTEVPR